MKRISTSTKATDLFGAGKHGWKDGNLVAAVKATDGEADWFNNLQEEVASVIEAAGIALNASVLNQLLQALPGALASRPEMARSLAANGYQKLPGGLILQWGTAVVNDGAGGAYVTFPIAFLSAMYFCSAICQVDNSAMSYTPGTVSGLAFSGVSSSVNLSNGAQFFWFALGR